MAIEQGLKNNDKNSPAGGYDFESHDGEEKGGAINNAYECNHRDDQGIVAGPDERPPIDLGCFGRRFLLVGHGKAFLGVDPESPSTGGRGSCRAAGTLSFSRLHGSAGASPSLAAPSRDGISRRLHG